jgi:hypothetical protein
MTDLSSQNKCLFILIKINSLCLRLYIFTWRPYNSMRNDNYIDSSKSTMHFTYALKSQKINDTMGSMKTKLTVESHLFHFIQSVRNCNISHAPVKWYSIPSNKDWPHRTRNNITTLRISTGNNYRCCTAIRTFIKIHWWWFLKSRENENKYLKIADLILLQFLIEDLNIFCNNI